LVNTAWRAEFQPRRVWMETLGKPSDRQLRAWKFTTLMCGASMPLLATTFARVATSDGAQASKRLPYLRVRGEIAIIGLSSAVPTAPLMATGRLGKKQVEPRRTLAPNRRQRLGASGLIHHRPWPGLRRPARTLGASHSNASSATWPAEAILHGHISSAGCPIASSHAARTVGGVVPVLSAPSAAAAAPRSRATAPLITWCARSEETAGASARAPVAHSGG